MTAKTYPAEYPRVYHKDHPSKIVKTQVEYDAAIAEGWTDEPEEPPSGEGGG